ncbi:MAG: precorrin-6y C5,15-methyltransferase (decarboxylating) subunit CbiE [Desulfobacteraceae bacterium]
MIDVVGTGFSLNDITEHQMQIIKSADLLVGGRRLLDLFRHIRVEKLIIADNISFVVEKIKKRMNMEKIVVLASGDPLFYGIGAVLVKKIGQEQICIHPNISSVQAAFAAIQKPWHDAAVLSLHGNKQKFDDSFFKDFFLLLEKNDFIAVLTDPVSTPGLIAQWLVEKSVFNVRIYVLENLRTDHEKISRFDNLQNIRHKRFACPNIVILQKKQKKADHILPAGIVQNNKSADTDQKNFVYPGMPDFCFSHENDLITKPEIRAVVLSKLKLVSNSHVLWDLGSGSGAVSIEASRFVSHGRIYAVEKNAARTVHIKENIKKFCIENIQVIQSDLPAGIEALEKPDRIFIGGGGRRLLEILKACCKSLSQNGIIVVNTVIVQNFELTLGFLRKNGFHAEFVQIQTAASKTMPFGDRLEARNPVWIITGCKNKKPFDVLVPDRATVGGGTVQKT